MKHEPSSRQKPLELGRSFVSAAAEIRTFGVSTQDVTAIDNWIEQVAAGWRASERAAFKARLCVAELAANVLEHGGPKSDGDHIVVMLSRAGDGIEVEFLDSLRPFDPTAEPATAKFPPSEKGGRGLVLVQAYADELSYSNDGTYNRIKLKIKSA
jgi:anti-sigma regulatory factor (Ser/Thr protein kinase)